MRIGLTGLGDTVDKVVRQAERAEADGFTSLWYTGAVAGDPLIAMAIAGRATERIELGTAILQTYSCHPTLMATRAASVAAAIGGAGRFTLGIGPSHKPFIEGILGMPYDHPGRYTEEFTRIVVDLLSGQSVGFQGEDFTVNAPPAPLPEDITHVPVLVAALGSRLLRVAGEFAHGTIPWLGNARAIEKHVAPRITAAAKAAGRPEPRIVTGLPVAVHDDEDEARETIERLFGAYNTMPNYQRLLAHGEAERVADVAIVGNEDTVVESIEAMFRAGATDFWAAPVAVGDDKSASRARARALLTELANS